VLDDTGFPKFGRSSVGVARQDCGALGKVANCQVGVSVHAATEQASCPLDWWLFLPEEWDHDAARRRTAHVPADQRHRPKWQLALELLDELAGWELVAPVVLADAADGEVGEFRLGLEQRELADVVQVPGTISASPQDVAPQTVPYTGRGRPPVARYRPWRATASGAPRCGGWWCLRASDGHDGCLARRRRRPAAGLAACRPAGAPGRSQAASEQGARQSASLSSLEAIAAALEVDMAALLTRQAQAQAAPRKNGAQADPGLDAVEVARLAERSDLGHGTLDTIDAIVDRLCRDYSREPVGWLLPKVNDRLGRVIGLLGGHVRLDEHRRLLVAAGWLEVLRATLAFDLRDRVAAEASRSVAQRLAVQAEHPEIVAWTFELQAWWALTDRSFRAAVDRSRQGQAVSLRHSSAMAQLAAQEARAWARLGDRRETRAALERADAALATLPVPDHPEHHFVFDGDKLHFYSATCYAWLGMADPAEEHAREVIRQCGDGRWKTRFANAHVDLGLARTHRGEIDGAAEAGQRALAVFDVPPSATLWRAADLDRALHPYGDVAEVRDWRERYTLARQTLQHR
jgi:tetratricopeptide (TPR) repeat protein